MLSHFHRFAWVIFLATAGGSSLHAAGGWEAQGAVARSPAIMAGCLLLALAGLVYACVQRRSCRRQLKECALSEGRLRRLFEAAPVAMLKADFSAVQNWLEKLRADGVSDFPKWLCEHAGEARQKQRLIKVILANQMAIDRCYDRIDHTRAENGQGVFEKELAAIWEGRTELLMGVVMEREPRQSAHVVLHWRAPVENGRPNYARVQIVFTDITELHHLRDQLRASEDRWQLAVDGINAGLWEHDLVTGHSFYSDRSREILGYAHGDLDDSPDTWDELVHPDDREVLHRGLRDYLEHRSPIFYVEHRMLARGGDYQWVLSRGRALFDSEGRPTRIVGTHSDIHARKAAEGALVESESRLRRIVAYADCVLWQARVTQEADGSFLWKYEVLQKDSRSRLNRLRGSGESDSVWGGAVLPDSEKMGEVAKEALIRGEDSYRQEYRIVREGETTWVSESVELTRLNPAEWNAVGVAVDITAIKQAEDALRNSERRLKLAFRGTQDGIWEHNYETGESYYSDRWKEILGYAPDEIDDASEQWVNRIHPEDRLRVTKAFNEHLQDHTPSYSIEFRLRCKDGSYKWILGRGIIVLDAQGRPFLSTGSHSDITDRKAIETALAADRERLSVTLRTMTEGVLTTDRAGIVQFINEAAETLTGWTDGAAIGRSLDEVCALTHPRTKAPMHALADTAVRESRVIDLPPSAILMHRQGVPVLVDGRCAPIRDMSSLPVGVVLVLHDVTERSRLENEIVKATKLESVGLLAGGIAHDFNNLLTVVMGNLTLAMLDTQAMGAAGNWLKEAEKGLIRARDLTQQLLTFSRGGEPVKAAVQLAVLVREAAEFCLHGSKVKCRYNVAPDLWAADVDKGQIGQVVQNLTINAMQAMPEGGCIHIDLCNDLHPPIRTRLDRSAIRMTVIDEGLGISMENIARIFDPYFTTKKEGNGLGLATVYSIIHKHGGHIEAESTFGKGTTFRVWLPATKDSIKMSAIQTPASGAMSGRVLFMDDEEAIRSMVETLLRRMGFDVVTTSEGGEALNAYTAVMGTPQAFTFVITDLTVPGGMGGSELMAKLCEVDPKVKVIVSSGYSSDPVMANYQKYGFKGMVPKPYRITDLAKVIRRVLDE